MLELSYRVRGQLSLPRCVSDVSTRAVASSEGFIRTLAEADELSRTRMSNRWFTHLAYDMPLVLDVPVRVAPLRHNAPVRVAPLPHALPSRGVRFLACHSLEMCMLLALPSRCIHLFLPRLDGRGISLVSRMELVENVLPHECVGWIDRSVWMVSRDCSAKTLAQHDGLVVCCCRSLDLQPAGQFWGKLDEDRKIILASNTSQHFLLGCSCIHGVGEARARRSNESTQKSDEKDYDV